MKNNLLNHLLLPLTAALVSLSPFAAAQSVWNGINDVSANTNWSTADNWLPSGVPGAATAVVFNDTASVTPAGTVNNVVDVGLTIASLKYGETNGTHTTLIASGVTLTNGGALTVGTETGIAITVPVANITGAGATLLMTNPAASLTVRQGGPSSAGSGQATLDMSGLDTFTATISRVDVASVASGANRSTGVLLLAKTNTITASGASPAISLGLSGSNNGSGNFTGGIVDILVTTMTIGQSSSSTSGSGNSVGTLTFDGGTINVNTLQVGRQTANTGKSGNGTVNVNTNATTGTAGTLVVNTVLNLSSTVGGAGAAISPGTLNINGGTVLANSIVPDTNHAGASTIAITAGGTLVVSNTAGTVSTPVTTFTTADGTLQISVSGATPEVVATTLNADGTANTINIAALPPISSFPVQFPIIQYSGSIGDVGFNFVLGSLPAGSLPYQGYLSNNVNNLSVDLVVTNGFAPIGADIWTGTTDTNWDLTTANWTFLGSPTLYQNGVNVQFDDTAAGATNVNLAAAFAPASVTVSNFAKQYIFGGPGAIIGSTPLTKYGDSALVFTNAGANTFSGGITINAGTVQFGNGGTGGNLPANAQPITDNGNLVLNFSNNPTVFGAISGTGNLWQNGSGVVSLMASNSYSGATIVNSGSLMVDGYLGGGGVVSNACLLYTSPSPRDRQKSRMPSS